MDKYTEEYLIKNADSVNWSKVCLTINTADYSIDFFDRFKSRIRWDSLSKNVTICRPVFIEKYHKNIDWNILSKTDNIPTNIIHRYKEYFNWFFISMSQNLSEEFIEAHKDYVRWDNIFMYMDLSEEFILKHQVFIRSWNDFTINKNLNLDFFYKYTDKIDWVEISNSWFFDQKFYDKFKCNFLIESEVNANIFVTHLERSDCG